MAGVGWVLTAWPVPGRARRAAQARTAFAAFRCAVARPVLCSSVVIVRALFSLAVAFLTVLLPCVEALAQTATAVATLGITAAGATAPPERRTGRSDTLLPTVINYDDCVADDTLTVELKVVGTGVSLEVWTGESADCSNIDVRKAVGADPALCWKIYSQAEAVTSTVILKVRDILKHEGGAGTLENCDSLADDPDKTGNGSLTVHFALVAGNVSGGMGVKLPLTFDLRGPTPPTLDTEVLPGEGRLFPSWTSTSAATADTQNYYVYCEETASLLPCTAPTLVAGQRLAADSPLKRGQAGVNAKTVEAKGLSNGTPYACAVAGYDKFANLGKLSNLACGVPEPVEGYFKQYRAAGGSAGGGYCGFGRTAAAPAGAAASLAALALLSLRRRARRRA